MFAKLLPLALAAIGTAAGVGAGIALRPDPAALADSADPAAHGESAGPAPKAAAPGGAAGGDDYLELDRQFVVPVLSEGRVGSMVVMSLTLALRPGLREAALDRAPRLHDRFLRVMLDHANSGGFDGTFTANGAMDRLEGALLEAGRAELGAGLTDILVLDLNRQDV